LKNKKLKKLNSKAKQISFSFGEYKKFYCETAIEGNVVVKVRERVSYVRVVPTRSSVLVSGTRGNKINEPDG